MCEHTIPNIVWETEIRNLAASTDGGSMLLVVRVRFCCSKLTLEHRREVLGHSLSVNPTLAGDKEFNRT